MEKPTATPWNYFRVADGKGNHCIHADNKKDIALVFALNPNDRIATEGEANAAYIVKAVNHHQMLVDVLKDIDMYFDQKQAWPSVEDVRKGIKDALTAVEEG